MFIIVILIIYIIYKNSKYKKLFEENQQLKLMLKKNENINNVELPKEKESILEKKFINEEENQELILNQTKEEQKIKIDKKKKNETELKNILIIATGSIFIILSAIVFLMSTWNLIPNIVKTLVLSLLTYVFFLGSKIAKNKFKLDKISQAFFYIGMAYIPICLLSISIFRLFGDYLSIYGNGKYIYLTFASIIVAFIYYYIYEHKNNKGILYGSLLSQVFGIMSFSLILSNDFIILEVNLLLYNIILMLITKKTIFKKMYSILPTIISVITLFIVTTSKENTIFLLALLALNFLILELNNSKKIYSYMFNIFLFSTGIYTVYVFNYLLGNDLSHLLIIFFVVLLYIIENMLLMKRKSKNLINSLSVVTITIIAILHIESYMVVSIITPYVLSTIQVIILIMRYKKSQLSNRGLIATLIPLYFIITGITIINKLDGSYYFYILFLFLTFILNEIFRKKDNLIHLNSFTILHLVISFTYLIVFINNFNNFGKNIWCALLMLTLYIYDYIFYKKNLFKYLIYFTINYVLFTLFRYCCNELYVLNYIPMISTLLIMAIETIFKNLQDKNNIYLIISKTLSFIYVYVSPNYAKNEISVLFLIIFATIIIGDNFVRNKKSENILPLICIIPAMFSNKSYNNVFDMFFMIFGVLTTLVLSLRERKISVYTIFSGLYLIFMMSYIGEKQNLNIILSILWLTIQWLIKKSDKVKDLFKVLIFILTLYFYNNSVLEFLKVEDYVVFSMLGYIIFLILILRKVMIKYIKNIDILEYIVFGYIYLYALFEYYSELDGMLFVFLLIAILIISYNKKYGALFMVTITSIIVNILALTREFWFSVPWWIYLLVIGTTLISFAIKNEANDNKKERKVINFLKNFKEKIDN